MHTVFSNGATLKKNACFDRFSLGLVSRINVVERNLSSAIQALSNRRLDAIIGIYSYFLASDMNYEI